MHLPHFFVPSVLSEQPFLQELPTCGSQNGGVYAMLESNQCCRTSVKRSTGKFSAYTGLPDLLRPRLRCFIASMLYKERCWALAKKQQETHSHR